MASLIRLDLSPLVTSTMAVLRSLVFGSVTGEVVEDLLEAMEDAIETVAGDSLRSTLDEELRWMRSYDVGVCGVFLYTYDKRTSNDTSCEYDYVQDSSNNGDFLSPS